MHKSHFWMTFAIPMHLYGKSANYGSELQFAD